MRTNTQSLLTPPNVCAWSDDFQTSDGADEGASEGDKRQTSEQHFLLLRYELGRTGGEGGEALNTWSSRTRFGIHRGT